MESELSENLEVLESICSSKQESDDLKLQHAKAELINKCNSVVSLPYNIQKQDVITMLYMIACNLARNNLLPLAAKVFECAKNCYNVISTKKSSLLDTDEIMQMKILFEAGECWKGLNNIERAIENYQSSLNLSFHCSDLMFEKKVCFCLSEAETQVGMYAEATVGYLRCLVILDDLVYNGMQTESELVEEKILVHHKLAITFLELKCFDEALEHAKSVHNLSSQPSAEILTLIGNLYDYIEDPESALRYYLLSLKRMSNHDVALTSVYNSIVCNLIKVKRLKEALAYSNKQLEISSDTKDEFNIYRASIHKGQILMLTGNFEQARNEFTFAMKLAQTFPDDYYCECKALCKVAESLSVEGRYMQALYECERALSLAKKSKSTKLFKGIQLEVALHSQHSTSEKELSSALVCLCEVIEENCVNFQNLAVQEQQVSMEDQDSFTIYCRALQVILHRLHHAKAAADIVQWHNHCMLFKSWNVPLPPVADLVTSKESAHNIDSLEYLQTDGTSYLMISCCKFDVLTIVINNGQVSTSLLSDRVISIRKTIGRIKQLLECLQPNDEKEQFLIQYTTEQRSLPKLKEKNTDMVLPVLKQVGCGDSSQTTEQYVDKMPRQSGDHGAEFVPEAALTELYDILIKPILPTAIVSGSSICVVVDGFLSKVSFDQLVDSSSNLAFGDTYNVITVPCLLSSIHEISVNTPTTRTETAQSLRDQHLTQTLENPTDLRSLEDIGIAKDLSGLVTSSATGINIMTSPRYVTPHKRVPFPVKTCVFGSPVMPSRLYYENFVWEPKGKLSAAENECKKVAEYLNVIPVTGERATKKQFLAEFSEATVMHIASYGDVCKGALAFTPNSFPVEEIPYSSLSYLVTKQDLEHTPEHLQLLVLSSGHGWSHSGDVNLPNIFLSAGVSCVVYSKWPVPDCVSENFFFHFYMNLQKSCKVSRALFNAKQATKQRFPQYSLWNAFTATGCDATIDLSQIRKSQLQNRLNELESPLLETPPFVEEVVSPEERFDQVQQALSRLSGCVSGDSDVISFLLGLVEEATERLTSDDNADRPVVIFPKAVEKVGGSVELLSLMGFDLQPVDRKTLSSERSSQADKMIVFPHWNQDGLLLPCHQALIGLHELCQNPRCLRTMALMLPLSQQVLSRLIDLLSILHHTPEVQLRTTDSSIRELWLQRSIRRYLKEIGIDHVQDLIFFSRSLLSRSCLLATLQFLTSFSLHRDQSVLEQLDVTNLGKTPQTDNADSPVELDSLKLALLPRNEVAVRSSWMSDRSFEKEKKERKKLADDIRELSEKFSHALAHAKWWHRDVRVPQQADNSLVSQSSAGEANPVKIPKVKVQSGATPSCNRTLVDGDKGPPSLVETLSRRQDARHILQRRCDDLTRRHAASVRSTYLRYADKAVI